MIVQVYKNLHKSRAADKNIYSVRNKKSGLVTNHVENIELKNVIFKVSEAGRQRVLKERRKNVHAKIEGTICRNKIIQPVRAAQVYYNPYKTEHFINLSTGEKIYSSKRVLINNQGVFIEKI
ncbi:hypothetical protein [Flavobacterium sp.]|uniref:hypothetical protein n=1 Tax=Flavobacterium sp. TaxID=239 RepID=UPI0038FCD538